jgi:hypothetical protein
MTQQMVHAKLSNLQLELLKVFHYQLPDQELLEIKELLAHYFAEKATTAVDQLWDQQHLTDETMAAWLHEHQRTPYQ